MLRFACARRLWILATCFVLLIPSPSSRAETHTSMGDGSAGESGPFTGFVQSPEANLFTGAMTMSVPIRIPPGRANATPSLSLSYSSRRRHGAFGYGWELALGRIERSTKHGVPRCQGDHTEDFVMHNAGGTAELVKGNDSIYRLKYDQAYLEAVPDTVTNTWTIKDRSGMTYVFSSNQSVFLNSVSCEFTSFWVLTQAKDPNGNVIDYWYTWDQGVAYPAEVHYGHNPSLGLTQVPFRIKFDLSDRSYPQTSYRRGNHETLAKKIDRIEVMVRPQLGAGYDLIRAYDLSYEDVPENGRLLLTQVDDDSAITGDMIPAQTFEYSSSDFDHTTVETFTPPSNIDCCGNDYLRDINNGRVKRTLLDMNGDGLVDLVNAINNSSTTWDIYYGQPSGGFTTSPVPWTLNDVGPRTGGSDIRLEDVDWPDWFTVFDTIDLNGDGLMDFVDSSVLPWRVHLGHCTTATQCEFLPYQNWAAPAHGTTHRRLIFIFRVVQSSIIDLNGDGRPDFIEQDGLSDPLIVHLNTGSGFVPWPEFDATGYLYYPHESGNAPIDINGDGLIDRVDSYTTAQQCAVIESSGNIQIVGTSCNQLPPPQANEGYACVANAELNNGRGFDAPYPVLFPTYLHSCIWRTKWDDLNATMIDLNSDQVVDRVLAYDEGDWEVQLNLGGDLALPTIDPGGELNLSPQHTWQGLSDELRQTDGPYHFVDEVLDWNGDGFVDHVDASTTPDWTIRLGGPASGDWAPPSLLVRAHNGIGGVTEVRYRPSTEFDNRDASGVERLPFAQWVVSAIRRSDGLCEAPSDVENRFSLTQNPCIAAGHESFQEIDYAGGLFDATSREFRGFQNVWVKDADENVRELTFSQDDATRGLVERDALYAGDPQTTGVLVVEERFVWETQASLDRTQIYLAEHRSEVFPAFSPEQPPPASQCQLNRNHPPDDYGRTLLSCSLPCTGAPPIANSCVGATAEQVDTVTMWADPLAGSHVRDRPSVVIVTDTANGLLSEECFRYDGSGPDGLSLHEAELGNLTSVESSLDTSCRFQFPDPDNPVVRYQRDGYGNVTQLTDALGHLYSSSYAPSSFSLYATQECDPTTDGVTHCTSSTWSLAHGQPTQFTDENNQVSSFAFDAWGRSLCEAQPGESLATCPGGSGNYTREFVYKLGNPDATSFADKLTYTEVRTQEPNAPGGYLFERAYFDALGRLRLKTAQRVIGSATALSTIVTGQTEYDAGGRPIRSYAPTVVGGSLTQPAISENPSGAHTEFRYTLNGSGNPIDPLGRTYEVLDPEGETTRTLYLGSRTEIVEALGRPLENTVVVWEDDFGRAVRREIYEGSSATPSLSYQYGLDGLGRLLTETVSDDPSSTVYHVYNMLGQRTQMIDPDSGYWWYDYDLNGNLVFRDDPQPSQHVQWLRDELGRVERVCLFSGSVAQSGFMAGLDNDCGPGQEESAYTYDDTSSGNHGRGRLTRVDDQAGHETLRYDHRGRTERHTREIYGEAKVIQSSYDVTNRLSSIVYPGGENVTYYYDPSGQVERVVGDSVYLDSATYDFLGRREKFVYGNGSEDVRSYLGAGDGYRLDRIHVYDPGSGASHLDQSYAYNELGKIERITDARNPSGALSNQASYDYDALGRLVGFDWLDDGPGTNDDTFDHDTLGNLILKGGHPLEYNASGPHHLSGSHSGRLYAYNFNGQRKYMGDPNPEGKPRNHSYSYDPLGRLIHFKVSEYNGDDDEPEEVFTTVHNVQYRYDYAGDRVAKRNHLGPWKRYFSQYVETDEQGEATKYYYAGSERIAQSRDPVAEAGVAPLSEPWTPPAWLGLAFSFLLIALFAGSRAGDLRLGVRVNPARAVASALLVLFVTLPAQAGRPRTSGGGSNPPAPIVEYYHVDHLGSTQVVTDDTGARVQQTRYHPYGEIRGRFDGTGAALGESDEFRHEFTGYQSEIESGLQYAGARYYDPAIGQFISPDPAREFASPYNYAAWDPINLTDPTGAFVFGGFFSFIGGFLGSVFSAISSFLGGLFGAVGISTATSVGGSAGTLSAIEQEMAADHAVWNRQIIVTPVPGEFQPTAGISLSQAIGFLGGGNEDTGREVQLAATTTCGFVNGGGSPDGGGCEGGGHPQGVSDFDAMHFMGAGGAMGRGPTRARGAGRPAKRSLSNKEAREWYHAQEDKIPEQVEGLPLREKALKAFKLRNKAKLEARELMADQETAKKLPPPSTLKEQVRKNYNKGLRGDDLWRAILESAPHSNKDVDSSLGIKR